MSNKQNNKKLSHTCSECRWLNFDFFEGDIKYYAEIMGVENLCGFHHKPIKIPISQSNNSDCGFEKKTKEQKSERIHKNPPSQR